MTEGPPPSAATSSKSTSASEASSTQTQVQASASTFSGSDSSSTQPLPQAYANYATWNGLWPSAYAGYFPATSNPPTSAHVQQVAYGSNPYAAHLYQPHPFPAPQFTKSTDTKPISNQPAKPPSPPASTPTSLPEPETYKDWDEVIRKFLIKCKLTQALKGLENDILVLSPEWEQKTIPDALKEMVNGLQSIIDRISGKQKVKDDPTQVEDNVDIMTVTDPLGGRPLEERKLDYAHLSLGVERRSPSSINKSISQFLARTRARNDASNRSEFLYTLAEKKKKLARSRAESSGQGEEQDGPQESEIVSCARVDAKPIDRDKQVKYDIAKYGEGPLTKTVKPAQDSTSQAGPSTSLSASGLADASPLPIGVPPSSGSEPTTYTKRKRKLSEINRIEGAQTNVHANSTRKGKSKTNGEEGHFGSTVMGPEQGSEEVALASATASKHPGVDERLKNLEEHLAVRYVPTPPRTLMARLQYLEDHVIKLEKEYPPWAALHFNQPRRGWPPPPRATPIIVPPHLRTVTSSSAPSTSEPNPASTNTTSASGSAAPVFTNQTPSGATNVKPRKTNSSLQKAVMERLEVQRAMNEMSGKGHEG